MNPAKNTLVQSVLGSATSVRVMCVPCAQSKKGNFKLLCYMKISTSIIRFRNHRFTNMNLELLNPKRFAPVVIPWILIKIFYTDFSYAFFDFPLFISLKQCP